LWGGGRKGDRVERCCGGDNWLLRNASRCAVDRALDSLRLANAASALSLFEVNVSGCAFFAFFGNLKDSVSWPPPKSWWEKVLVVVVVVCGRERVSVLSCNSAWLELLTLLFLLFIVSSFFPFCCILLLLLLQVCLALFDFLFFD